MREPICSNCGGPAIIGEISIEEQQLRIENARLKDELDRVCALAGKFLGRAAVPVSPPLASSSCLEEYGGGMMMMERCVYLEMGLAAMDEIVKMANEEEPLWVREKLNEEEYLRMFSGSCFGVKHINNGFVFEASRQTALVFLNTSALLDTLMDPVSQSSPFSLSLFTQNPKLKNNNKNLRILSFCLKIYYSSYHQIVLS